MLVEDGGDGRLQPHLAAVADVGHAVTDDAALALARLLVGLAHGVGVVGVADVGGPEADQVLGLEAEQRLGAAGGVDDPAVGVVAGDEVAGVGGQQRELALALLQVGLGAEDGGDVGEGDDGAVGVGRVALGERAGRR